MRQLWLVALGILACVLLLAVPHILDFERRREARAGLDSTLARLSMAQDLVALKTVYGESSLKGCYYATGYVILGSSLAAPDALAAHEETLESSGWTPSGIQYEEARVLIRGMNERVAVYFGEPGFEIKDAVDYAELGKTYRSFIFARFLYIVPAREGC